MPKSHLVVLTSDEIRQQLRFSCKKHDGSFKSIGAIKNIESGLNQMLKLGFLSESHLAEQLGEKFNLVQKHILYLSLA